MRGLQTPMVGRAVYRGTRFLPRPLRDDEPDPEPCWRAVAGQDPADRPIALRPRPSALDDLVAHAALALALGSRVDARGRASAADVTATVLRVAARTGCATARSTSPSRRCWSATTREGAVPLTAMRTVRLRGMDYARLQGITEVARAGRRDGLDVEEAHRRLDLVVSARPTYRRTVHALGWVGMAASVAFLLGGGWLVALTAALTTALIEQSMRALNRRGLPRFFQQAVGAGIATSVAVLLVAWEVPVRPSLVVAAGIVVLLAGLSLVGSAQDAINGFPLTAAARAFEVLTLTAGIVVGIAGVLDVAQRALLPLDVAASSPPVPYAVGLAASPGSPASGRWPRTPGRARSACAARRRALLGDVWAAGELGSGPAVAERARGGRRRLLRCRC
jgi:uncharacterized membrane protein YjjP (DUF1212 family)